MMRVTAKRYLGLLVVLAVACWLAPDAMAQTYVRTTQASSDAPKPVVSSNDPLQDLPVWIRTVKQKGMPFTVVDYDKGYIKANAGGSAHGYSEISETEDRQQANYEFTTTSLNASASATVFGLHANLLSARAYANSLNDHDRAPSSYATLFASIHGETVVSIYDSTAPTIAEWSGGKELAVFDADKWFTIACVPVRVSIKTSAVIQGGMFAAAKYDSAIQSWLGVYAYGEAGAYVDAGLFLAGIESIVRLLDCELDAVLSSRPHELKFKIWIEFTPFTMKVALVLYVRVIDGDWWNPFSWEVKEKKVGEITIFKYSSPTQTKTVADLIY